MTLKDDFKTAIQTCAEAAFAGAAGSKALRGALRLGFGTPGVEFLLDGETRTAGQAYDIPGSIDCILEGLANTLGPGASSTLIPLLNDSGATFPIGTMVGIVGNLEIGMVVFATPGGIVGVVVAPILTTEIGLVAVAGVATVLLETGNTPVAGDMVGLSTTAGEATVTGVETEGFGTIIDTTGYADPANRLVQVSLQMRPRA